MKSYHLHIPGKPVGKQRPRTVTKDGRTWTYTPQKTVDYEKLVKQTAIDNGVPLMDRVKLSLKIYIPCRWKFYKTKPDEPREPLARPDLTNIIKSIEDGLQGVAYKDDKHIMELDVKWRLSVINYSCVNVIITEVNWEDYII